jgi:hypothetical protein
MLVGGRLQLGTAPRRRLAKIAEGNRSYILLVRSMISAPHSAPQLCTTSMFEWPIHHEMGVPSEGHARLPAARQTPGARAVVSCALNPRQKTPTDAKVRGYDEAQISVALAHTGAGTTADLSARPRGPG